MTRALPTFEVSKKGLAKLLERRGGKAFAVTELIQNAWDTDATRVTVQLLHDQGQRYILHVGDDDPNGFTDLSHAYTLFAESEKKADPTKRGRFNLGEKFVIAVCDTAEITSTTGTVTFDSDGRTVRRRKLANGSAFTGTLRLTRDEVKQIEATVHSLIPPAHVITTYNGDYLRGREPLRIFETTLATEVADDEGRLRPTRRITTVSIFEPIEGETPSLYELGIPVVETNDRWHVNIEQKVPLNSDRDNVTPAYLRSVRAEVLNNCASLLTTDGSGEKWIDDGLSDERVNPAAITVALDKRFGAKRVTFDPSDPEANKLATAAGYVVIPARALPKGVAARAADVGAVRPAGQVTPSPQPYGDGPVRKTLPEEKWTPGITNIVGYARALADKLLDVQYLRVDIVNDAHVRDFGATYSKGHLEFNLRSLGRSWFDHGPTHEVNVLLIHEFGHHFSEDHLSSRYHGALCSLGAKLTKLALDDPGFFKKWDSRVS